MSETGFTVFRGILEKSFDEPPVGRPIIDIDIYLIDENENIVEGAGKGELCFVNEYVRGYINLPEQTQKAFRPMKGNPEKILFHTNDIFRRDSDGRYYVVGRIDDMMKINGNRIEPGEIEAKIKEITGLDDVMAKGFSEKDHAYIAVYFLREEAAKKGIWNGKTFSIDQEKLLKLLPSYMIPTYYVPLDAFPLNANGKMTRKGLPAPDLAAMKGAYIAPETELERYICDAMSKVLKLDRMSVTEDFFVAGGDSLTAMSLLSEADIDDLTTDDLFKKRTPRAIAKALKERIRKGSIDELEDSARKVPHNITPLQRQIIDVQLFKPYATMWNNMRFLARFDLSIDAERLCIALNKALQNHPSLSVAFRFNDDNELEQQYIPGLLSERKIHEISEKDAERLSKELVKPFFKIFNSCLCRADIFRSPKYVYMFIDIHHLLIDGTSYGILLDDIVKAYNGQELKKDYYFAMLQEEEERIASGKMKEAEYWFKNTYGDEVWCEIVPPYYDSKNINQAERIRRLDFNLEKVNEAETYWGVTHSVMAIAAALLALSRFTGKKHVMTNWIFNNRLAPKAKNIVGMLIKNLPVAVKMEEISSIQELLQSVKNQVIEGISHSSYDFMTEHYRAFLNDCMEVNLQFGVNDNKLHILQATFIDLQDPFKSAGARLELELIENEADDGIFSKMEYAEGLFEHQSMEKFHDLYIEIFENLVAKSYQPLCQRS